MLVAHYIGDHAGDTLAVRLGWAATRLVQRGEFKRVTHCEAILSHRQDGTCTIASSSIRDGGVRVKHGVRLNPAHWLIADVPQWSPASAAQWFAQHLGQPYDLWGAWATALPGHHSASRHFCNEAVGASVGLRSPHSFGPAQFAAICFSFGRDVTAEFIL